MTAYDRRLERLEQSLGVGLPVLRVIYEGRCVGCQQAEDECCCRPLGVDAYRVALDGHGVRYRIHTGVPPSEVYP